MASTAIYIDCEIAFSSLDFDGNKTNPEMTEISLRTEHWQKNSFINCLRDTLIYSEKKQTEELDKMTLIKIVNSVAQEIAQDVSYNEDQKCWILDQFHGKRLTLRVDVQQSSLDLGARSIEPHDKYGCRADLSLCVEDDNDKVPFEVNSILCGIEFILSSFSSKSEKKKFKDDFLTGECYIHQDIMFSMDIRVPTRTERIGSERDMYGMLLYCGIDEIGGHEYGLGAELGYKYTLYSPHGNRNEMSIGVKTVTAMLQVLSYAWEDWDLYKAQQVHSAVPCIGVVPKWMKEFGLKYIASPIKNSLANHAQSFSMSQGCMFSIPATQFGNFKHAFINKMYPVAKEFSSSSRPSSRVLIKVVHPRLIQHMNSRDLASSVLMIDKQSDKLKQLIGKCVREWWSIEYQNWIVMNEIQGQQVDKSILLQHFKKYWLMIRVLVQTHSSNWGYLDLRPLLANVLFVSSDEKQEFNIIDVDSFGTLDPKRRNFDGRYPPTNKIILYTIGQGIAAVYAIVLNLHENEMKICFWNKPESTIFSKFVQFFPNLKGFLELCVTSSIVQNDVQLPDVDSLIDVVEYEVANAIGIECEPTGTHVDIYVWLHQTAQLVSNQNKEKRSRVTVNSGSEKAAAAYPLLDISRMDTSSKKHM